MKMKLLGCSALFLVLLAPVGAHAQGVVGGATATDQGDAAAKPAGPAVVVGAVGAVTGGVGGLLGVDQRPRFHDYVAREHKPSYRSSDDVRIGVTLPSDGVQYYDVPPEYGVKGYSYTVVNDRTVLVDPKTRQIVQILD